MDWTTDKIRTIATAVGGGALSVSVSHLLGVLEAVDKVAGEDRISISIALPEVETAAVDADQAQPLPAVEETDARPVAVKCYGSDRSPELIVPKGPRDLLSVPTARTSAEIALDAVRGATADEAAAAQKKIGEIFTVASPIPQRSERETAPDRKTERCNADNSAAFRTGSKGPDPDRPFSAANVGRTDLWNDSDTKTLVKMTADGFTQSHIAAELGRSVGAVKSRLKALRDAGDPTVLALGELRGRNLRGQKGKAATKARVKSQPSAQPAAPAAAPSARPTAGAKAKLTGLARQVLAHLDGLEENFAPEDDLALANAVMSRTDMTLIADFLGVTVDTAAKRWDAIRRFEPIQTDRGHLSIDGQPALMTALRYRAAQAEND